MSDAVDTLICPRISLSASGLSWDSLNVFDSALEMPFHHVSGALEFFEGGRVQIGWHDNRLLILATMYDVDVYTDATADNQRLWTLGDVFEMFLRDQAMEEYFELHTAPTGHRLQLRFPTAQTVQDLRARAGAIESLVWPGEMLHSLVRQNERGWQVLSTVDWPIQPMAGRRALVSFSRYDYTRNQKPVLSSTSLHQVANFHRQEDWIPIVFAV
jgi:hypothetical protein